MNKATNQLLEENNRRSRTGAVRAALEKAQKREEDAP